MVGAETVVESLMEPVFAVGTDGTILFANRRFLAVTQLSRTEVVGADHALLEEFVDDGFDDLCDAVGAVGGGRTDERRIELTMRHPSAAPVPQRLAAEARVTPLVEDGARVGALVALRDVTDRKERTQELQRYEAIIDEILDAAYVLDEHGRYTFVNRRLAEVHDTSPDELVGTESWTFRQVVAEYGEETYQALVRGDRTELRVETELDFPEYGSGIIELRLSRLPRAGEFEGIVGIARDVTEQKERERELERQNERLEEFASVVSHDLRNPLNVAKGRLAVVREERDSEHLAAVAEAHDRIEVLISDLLTLAREGESVREVEPVALSEVVNTCWSHVETGEATLVLDTEQTVRADPDRLQQLLENLLRNAVDHGSTNPPSETPEGAVEHGSTTPPSEAPEETGERVGTDLTVTVGDLADGFYVADDGPGIPDADRERVFESGYSTADGGTGFGLAIVQEIVEAHGWTIRATESETGGARFEIRDVDVVP